MNCQDFQDRLSDLLELQRHLEACPDCRREHEEAAQALDSIRPAQQVSPSAGFKDRVMNRIMEEHAGAGKPSGSLGFRWFFRLAAVGALAALLVVGFSFLGRSGKGYTPSPFNLLAQSVLAMSNVHTVHITARMRTLPHDSFDLIGLDYDFVPVEMWKQSDNPTAWRIEKPGRVAVMDGTSSVLWIKPNEAARGGVDPGFADFLKTLLDADQVLDRELQRAQQRKSELLAVQQSNSELLLTARVKAQNSASSDWLRNKFFFTSDHSLVYRFDAATKRLTGMKVFVHEAGGDVLVFEITGIVYDAPLDPALFSLKLPADVLYSVEPGEMPPVTGPPLVTARDAAQAFFDGCAREDWDRVLQVYPARSISPDLKEYLGGIELLSLSEPFEINLYPLDFDGWFVPYQIRFKNGYVKKFNLALRRDNRTGRWYVDGGF